MGLGMLYCVGSHVTAVGMGHVVWPVSLLSSTPPALPQGDCLRQPCSRQRMGVFKMFATLGGSYHTLCDAITVDVCPRKQHCWAATYVHAQNCHHNIEPLFLCKALRYVEAASTILCVSINTTTVATHLTFPEHVNMTPAYFHFFSSVPLCSQAVVKPLRGESTFVLAVLLTSRGNYFFFLPGAQAVIANAHNVFQPVQPLKALSIFIRVENCSLAKDVAFSTRVSHIHNKVVQVLSFFSCATIDITAVGKHNKPHPGANVLKKHCSPTSGRHIHETPFYVRHSF